MAETNFKPLVVAPTTARKMLDVGNTKFWELVKERKIEMVQVGKRRMPTYASLERLASITDC